MRLLGMSQVKIPAAGVRAENRARVDAKELSDLLAKVDDFNGDQSRALL